MARAADWLRPIWSATGKTKPGGEIPPNATVDDYVELAMLRNPSIKAARQRIRRLEHRIPQATSLEDPVFSVASVGEMAETAAGQVDTMMGVSQHIPTPGKLSTRGQIAEQDVAVARQELTRRRLLVEADVRRAYWNYYAAARGIEVVRDSRSLLEDIRRIATARYESGTVSQQDVLRASVALGNLDNELTELQQRKDSARAMLNRLMDREPDAPLGGPEKIPLRVLDLKIDTLLNQAERSNPQLEALRKRLEQYRLREKLARLERWPDVTLSANYNAVDDSGLAPSATGDDQWWFGLSFNLPIWLNKLDAAQREARRGQDEAAAELADARNRVAFRIRDAVLKARSDLRQAEMFRESIIPETSQALRVATSEYRSGREDFLTLLENWRKLLEFELMYHRAVARLEQDYAALEQTVGTNLTAPMGLPAEKKNDKAPPEAQSEEVDE